MTARRTLTLRAERLSELTADELTAVNGGISKLACVTRDGGCNVSDMVISLCGCFSNYCSIDVC